MMIKDLKAHYQRLYAQSGDSPAAVQYPTHDSQVVRFSILSCDIDKSCNIIDLGCGLADMLPYLRQNGFTGKYLGCDFVPEFIELAKRKYGKDPCAKFMEFNILQDVLPTGYDYVLISGIFNNKIKNNQEFIELALKESMAKVNLGVVFNALSDYVQYQDETLFYISPLTLFDYCKRNLTPYVTLKHDYLTKPGGFPYEFTMWLRHEETL
jgi:SAM-dependent methyltransferase